MGPSAVNKLNVVQLQHCSVVSVVFSVVISRWRVCQTVPSRSFYMVGIWRNKVALGFRAVLFIGVQVLDVPCSFLPSPHTRTPQG